MVDSNEEEGLVILNILLIYLIDVLWEVFKDNVLIWKLIVEIFWILGIINIFKIMKFNFFFLRVI